ncbi:MAG: sulfotransferase domain-containing protein, partial [Acidimicrobiia bacterium]|nr:sulfotransferase domain-containing protein [Acidimicrobiia bacterium]
QPDDNWYRSLFTPAPGQISGEFTPDYALIEPDRIRRVAALNPDLRVIYMLRNPIERAWSHAAMTGRSSSGVTTGTDWFDTVLSNPRLRMHTDYPTNLDNWLSVFAPQQMFVGFLEDISFHPGLLLASVYEFLGVDPDVASPMVTRRVYAGNTNAIPTALAVRLAEEYHPQLVWLADRFGGYATVWLAIAEDLLRRPPPQPHIRYPFWDSDLPAAQGYRPPTGDPPQVQSAPLG